MSSCVCCCQEATRQDLSGEWWCEDCPDLCIHEVDPGVAEAVAKKKRRQEAVKIAKAVLCSMYDNHEFCRHKETP